MTNPRIGLIWAEAEGGIIGRNGIMPWNVPEDLARFKRVTLGGPVIMGRKTWDSLPPRFRPLPGRRNIVVTRQSRWAEHGAEAAPSVANALVMAAEDLGPDETAWVIGGGEIYAAVIDEAERLEVTEIRAGFEGDAKAPVIGPEWTVVRSDPEEGWHESRSGLSYRFVSYERA
ncbi:dihydrofolate reductase [Salinibacterium sp. dk2585]|uniref:dihydrofolate reductase n=1 Tax=unclassified Salinibacterium TaxID=2632331 RepID=UPI0011C252A3|nr:MULTISPECIES: dihydrofolate reductase [unclassified Salinibacterium]QEE61666.1 dihydrofolate reductase [Salinibacterium sp. dk2585]TXK54782.1 dihydrofolate reductase [Salinibacterium sp. dk5596]